MARLAGWQLKSLAANVACRQALGRVYTDELAGVHGLQLSKVTEGAEPAWIQFPIFVARKEACYQYLLRQGVDLNWTFRYSCGVTYQVRNAPNSGRF